MHFSDASRLHAALARLLGDTDDAELSSDGYLSFHAPSPDSITIEDTPFRRPSPTSTSKPEREPEPKREMAISRETQTGATKDKPIIHSAFGGPPAAKEKQSYPPIVARSISQGKLRIETPAAFSTADNGASVTAAPVESSAEVHHVFGAPPASTSPIAASLTSINPPPPEELPAPTPPTFSAAESVAVPSAAVPSAAVPSAAVPSAAVPSAAAPVQAPARPAAKNSSSVHSVFGGPSPEPRSEVVPAPAIAATEPAATMLETSAIEASTWSERLQHIQKLTRGRSVFAISAQGLVIDSLGKIGHEQSEGLGSYLLASLDLIGRFNNDLRQMLCTHFGEDFVTLARLRGIDQISVGIITPSPPTKEMLTQVFGLLMNVGMR